MAPCNSVIAKTWKAPRCPQTDSFGNTAAVLQTREGPTQEQQKMDGMEVGGAWNR